MPTTTSLYLDFQLDRGAPDEALRVLKAAIGAAPIASGLLRPAAGMTLDARTARPFITTLQEAGIAALAVGGMDTQRKLGADGIHVPWSSDIVREFKTLRQAAPQETIIGADAGRSRHDAMEMGEGSADYVAFGIPPHVEDRGKAAERQRDLIAWWSELFEIPCVAFDIETADAAHRLAAAGADFVSVRVTSADAEQAAAARVREFSEALKMPEPAK
ncbi:MAG: thiamine phosphate synthase [Proteobacteria bacterium]|nr:thiamine phosphate synthase [Pseudomonadota bacterium]